MDEKELLEAMHTQSPEHDAMLTKVGVNAIDGIVQKIVEAGGKARVIDDAFMREAMKSVLEGSRRIMEQYPDKQHPPLQFIFVPAEGPDGKLACEIGEQGMGLPISKAQMLDAAMSAVEDTKGKLFIVFVDEAYMFAAKLAKDDPLVAKIEAGDLKVSELPPEQRKEALVLNGIGYGVQYMLANEIRREDGKLIFTEGEIISSNDKGARLGGKMSAPWARRKH